ncbi:hypothetical protein GGE48_000238 [Rhizobium leguminosarum]|nr:hypothetical protein [Rhizobium leguminosarum]
MPRARYLLHINRLQMLGTSPSMTTEALADLSAA